ncbi:MAG: VRR-NUC domain-containing protein [Gammaproteobacteria bacterium]|jgi:hypothetical protein|nr:VRR-NUC domain-containing protein [Gammaproteobacteria bacterium]
MRSSKEVGRVPTEHEEQREFVKWFRQTYKGVRIFAVPNGEKRAKTTAMRLKAEGVSSGVPDLYIPAWKVWVEMKRTKGGSVSVNQKDWIVYLESIGDTVAVCKGADQAKLFIIQCEENALQC